MKQQSAMDTSFWMDETISRLLPTPHSRDEIFSIPLDVSLSPASRPASPEAIAAWKRFVVPPPV